MDFLREGLMSSVFLPKTCTWVGLHIVWIDLRTMGLEILSIHFAITWVATFDTLKI